MLKDSKNGFSIFHWCFPLECRFLNKENYEIIIKLDETKKIKLYEDLINQEKKEKKRETKDFLKCSKPLLKTYFLLPKVITWPLFATTCCCGGATGTLGNASITSVKLSFFIYTYIVSKTHY